MRRAALPAAAAALAAAALAGAPAAAQAGWDPPQLASVAGGQQGSDASTAPALSADGRWLAFSTASHDLVPATDPPGVYVEGGIVRRDLATGALALVARGAEFPEGDALDDPTHQLLGGARAPSISADGRYVAFTTDEALVPGDANGAFDVYVRDMDLPIGDSKAYTLVSAPDGGDTAPQYTTADGTAPSTLGAQTAPRTAISADGRTVAFRTAARSTLPDGTDFTDAGQVLVRELDTDHTTLVTTTPAGDPAGGAQPVVVLSADGSTAAWTTDNVAGPTEVRYVDGEVPSTDVLWRRLGGPIRRVSGSGDPDDPGCAPGGTITTNPYLPATLPCDGPLTDPFTVAHVALSADGSRALVVARAAQRGVLPVEGGTEILSIDLRPGVTRKAAFSELTVRSPSAEGRSTAAIDDVALAPGGRYAAFTTARTVFPAGLRLVGDPSPTFDPTIDDVYVADLAAGTATLVTHAVDGGKPDQTSSEPTVADTGAVAFASVATRLVAGDANGASDVFYALTHATVLQPAVDILPPAADPVAAPVARRVRATAQALASGSVRVTVVGPGAGGVQVRLGARGGRRVALRATTMPRTGTVTVTLTPRLADRRRLRSGAGLAATLRATFHDTTGALTRARSLRLKAPKPKAKPKTKTTKKAAPR